MKTKLNFDAGVPRFEERAHPLLSVSHASIFLPSIIMIGHNRIGAGAYTSAIVQEAKKDWQYYEAKIAASEECTGRLYREYKEGGTWKEKYKTWADACEVLGKSRSQVNRVIQQDKALDNGASCATERKHAESVSLKKVEEARTEPEPKEEEPEKPAVHSADEKVPATNGHKPRDNGKPKSQLAIWREVEQTLFGRALNRVDELNRHCPNPYMHAQLISQTKDCMATLERWKATVK